ncbi:FAD-binding protein [Vibrio sp. CAU 1672]|uniref:electron transfer flavoprotein subunit alpha/FixB family protein n=1 Tax=Vibrio sp. CAU 1672 TaxID=3032594 RepID=UPI0023DCE9D5|nr:FAD-binding protein [Vibrio sp. CAU 1672]MDF2153397.1 FAD-binding protein [Vibrio sp. CAU 1672]
MEQSNLSALVVIEHDNHTVSVDSLKTLQAAAAIHEHDSGAPVSALVMGYQCDRVVAALSRLSVLSEILVVDAAPFEHPLAENMSKVIADIGRNYTHLLAAATTFGKNLLPRVAALLDVGQLSDVIAIESPDVVVRPVYAGNALARVKSVDAIKVVTVRSSAFDPVLMEDTVVVEKITRIEPPSVSECSVFVSQQKAESERPELPAARVVVSGGRGLANKDNFALVEQLADKLGGAIGASRAAVDAGFVSNDLQVGQTGKIVAPELYIALGISGAIQHLAGMKDSKVIVAINRDPDAPIFEIADYGLVADLFEVLPDLIDKV